MAHFKPIVLLMLIAMSCNDKSGGSSDRDCGDFSTQESAQSYFNRNGGSRSNNVDGLDADRDGIACESLPLRANIELPDASSRILTIDPECDAVRVPVDVKITVVFSPPVLADTNFVPKISLEDSSGTTVDGTASYDDLTYIGRFVPSFPLANDHVFTIVVVSQITSGDGSFGLAEHRSNFRTEGIP